MKSITNNKSAAPFIVIGLIWGILSNVTVHSGPLSLLVALVAYLIVYFFVLCGKTLEAFNYFLLFTALTIEVDYFITGAVATPIDRWSFSKLPLFEGHLYILTLVILFFSVQKKYSRIKKKNVECDRLKRWLYVLLVTGLLSIVVGMIVNDNGIMNRGYYPKVAISQLVGFLTLFFVILTTISITKSEDDTRIIKKNCERILIIVSITILLSVFIFGMTGVNSDEKIMMSPLSISFTPMLIAFFFYKDCNYKYLAFICGILIFIASFFLGTMIGSKWYIILIAALAETAILATGVKSLGNVLIVGLLSIILLSIFAEPLLNMIGNEYIGWKLSQTLNLFNFVGGSGGDWYGGLDHSTLYRLDEPNNIIIEYINKPWFALFGKGFGGTTLHYTDILSWEFDPGAFSDAQRKMGAYSEMHESIAVILLRHGIIGVLFIVVTMINLFKKMTATPWAMVALIWFLFDWAYGTSLLLGAVALVLVYAEQNLCQANKV